MKLNKKGFTLIEGLLVVIALSLVIGVGFYVANANKDQPDKTENLKEQQASEQAKIATETNAPAVDPYSGWKTYNKKGLIFKYPADYYLDTSENFVEISSFVPGGDLDCPSQGYSIPKCEVKISILETGTFDDDNGNKTDRYFSYGPEDSDLKNVAEKIIATIKRN